VAGTYSSPAGSTMSYARFEHGNASSLLVRPTR
jgi:hypothetical protein